MRSYLISIFIALNAIFTTPVNNPLPAQGADTQAVMIAAHILTTPPVPVARGAVAGVVSDVNGKPVSYALVQITERASGASVDVRTSPSGRFTTNSLKAGEEYSVLVRKIGYRPMKLNSFTVTPNNTQQINFKMGVIDPIN